MSFSQALSGLSAQSENLKVIGNNISNSQTVGFKSGNAVFADVFAGANSKVGLGTSVAAITQDFTSGDLENSGRNLDLAVAGEGFYRLESTSGEAVFSRNGQFNQDSDGYLVNATGQRLTGYGLSDPNDPFSDVVVGGAPEALQIPQDDIPAQATTEASAIYNLDASTQVGNDLQSATVRDGSGDGAEEQDVQYHYSNSYTAYDSLGNEHVITQYFRKSGDNQWDVQVAMDGVINGYQEPPAGTADGTPAADGDNAFTLEFDGNGALQTNDEGAVTGVGQGGEGNNFATLNFDQDAYGLDGAEELSFEFTLTGTTQYNNSSVQNTLSQDGYSSGSLAGIEVLEDGTIMRNYTNEERRAAGQLVLGSFANAEGLQPDGDNSWRATNASGEPVIGEAGTGRFGTIASGVLENSNVDLASELVDMIVAQRAYQANSSSISTQDELLQTVIQL
ncbi:MAG: flagellar hook protein FlgE [Pseudomonadota bacterium]